MLDRAPRPATLHQIAGGGRSLREVRHPLPPELLVAEFAGELPPDVARAVREHVAGCESCGARAKALAAPYDLLAALGGEPVPFVPDLRRSVRTQLEHGDALERLLRLARKLGRGGMVAVLALSGLALLLALLATARALQPPGTGAVERSTNGVSAPPAAGTAGVLYAVTGKVVPVPDATGRLWPVAEVIAVGQPTGRVVRSLPDSTAPLRVAAASEAPMAEALSPDGRTLYELTGPQQGVQALIALDADNGQVRFVKPLDLPAGVQALGVTIAPDSQEVYVGLSLGAAGLSGPRALAISVTDTTGVRVLAPSLPASVPLPAPGGALPGTGPRPAPPPLATSGLRASLAAGGALAISPDGLWLFDVVALADASGPRAVVVRRIAVASGATVQALALLGDFTFAALASSPDPLRPLLYLARGGPNGEAEILSATGDGPTLLGQIALGGPAAAPGTVFDGHVTISPMADGARAYISADITGAGGQIQSHDIWLVDSASATIAAHSITDGPAGQVLANWTGGASGRVFALRGSAVVLLPSDLRAGGDPPTWLALADGGPLLSLVGTGD